MEIRLLGNVEIHGDPAVVRLRRSGERCVLAVLAVHAAKPVTVTTLVDHLWSGAEQSDKAIDTIGTYLRRIRAAIKQAGGQPDWLRYNRASRTGLLDIDPSWVDYHQFTALAATARRDQNPRVLQTALRLWQGPALADIIGPWADHRRHIMETERLTVYEDLLRHELSAGHYTQVARTAADLAETTTPTDRLLLLGARGLAGSGQHTAIRGWATRVTHRMRETAGVTPSTQILDQIEQILAHHCPSLPSPASTVPPATFNPRTNVLTAAGRQREPHNPRNAVSAIRDANSIVGAPLPARGEPAALESADQFPDDDPSLACSDHDPGPAPLMVGDVAAARSGRVATFDALWDGRATLPTLLTMVTTSWDRHLARISQHDRCTVNAQRQLHSVQVSQALRADRDGADRWLLVYDWEITTTTSPQIVGLRHCRLGRMVVDHEAHLLVAEMLFHRPLTIGETLIMDYQVINPTCSHARTADSYCRRLRLPVRDYALEVQFSPDDPPLRCHQVSAPPHNARTIRRDLAIDSTSSAHTVTPDLAPGLFGMSWYWPPNTQQLKAPHNSARYRAIHPSPTDPGVIT